MSENRSWFDSSLPVASFPCDFVTLCHGILAQRVLSWVIPSNLYIMNTHLLNTLLDSETELSMGDTWETLALAELIHSRSSYDTSPAFLILGKHEVELLRRHLVEAFGEEAVATMHYLYYMGLEVVEVEKKSFLRVAGSKVIRTLQDPIARRQAWRDREYDSGWHLRIA